MGEHPGKEFYEDWAEKQKDDPLRNRILRWKAVNMANLVLKKLTLDQTASIAEIGGAEGIVLASMKQDLNADTAVNYELSTSFCNIGKPIYPSIEFYNDEFEKDERTFDLIILSDILEHLEDDVIFLEQVAKRCNYLITKIPIEICFMLSSFWYQIQGLKKPDNIIYGPNHYNGHLRGYTINDGFQLISKRFTFLDSLITDVTPFYGSDLRGKILKIFGVRATIALFGGALFILAKSKLYK